MSLTLSNNVPAGNVANATVSSDAISHKTHISSTQGSRLNLIAQQKSMDEIATGVSDELAQEIEAEIDRPVIRQSTGKLTNKSQMLLTMLRYQSASNSMSESMLANAAAVFNAQANANIQKAQELSTELDKLKEEFDTQSGVINNMQEAFDSAKTDWGKANSKLNDAQNTLNNLLDDPDAQSEDIQKAQTAVAVAQQGLTQAAQAMSTAQRNLDKALDGGQKILNNINAKTAEMNTKFSNVQLNNPASTTAEQHSEQALTRTAIMIQLITEFIMKMDDVSTEKLKNDLEINKMQTQARQAEMKRKSDEYEEQVRKAEEAQKTAGCIGKILGGLAVAFGAITTIFGGGGVALMAVGIALMVADPIVEAITGQSLTGMIMDPLMEHVLMPLMNVLGDIVSAIFDYTPLGLLLNAIDKATGANMMDTIHTVVTAAVAIAAIVAVAFVAKSAAKFLIEKMSQAMTSAIVQTVKAAIAKAINKLIPTLVKNAAKQGSAATRAVASQVSKSIQNVTQSVTKNVTGFLKGSESSVLNNLGKINMNHIMMANVGVNTSNGIIQSGMSMNIANIQLEAQKALASFQLAQTDLKILSDIITSYLSRFKQDQDQVQKMGLTLSDMLQNQAAAGASVIKNMKA
ncbi:type III secretion system translocon subunit SctE [Pseudescherichia vulneris]